MATPKRIKTAAQISVPQTLEEVTVSIREIGDLDRQITRITTVANDSIAALTEGLAVDIQPLQERLKALQAGVQAYCEANRDTLTNGGKTKTVNVTTGEVSWRTRPPSVRLTKVDKLLDALHDLGLEKFIRIKEEINRDAILAEPEAVRHLAGVKIVTGIEDFSITPFEQEVE